MIRKIQFAPANNKAGPKADISKQFMMTDKPLNLEASLEKEVHRSLQTSFSAWYIYIHKKYNRCSTTHKESFSHVDLLPRRSDHREGKSQQRNQQGCEENQSLRWAVRSLDLNS